MKTAQRTLGILRHKPVGISMEDWSRDCELLLLVEILAIGSFGGCGRVWEGSSKGKGGVGRDTIRSCI